MNDGSTTDQIVTGKNPFLRAFRAVILDALLVGAALLALEIVLRVAAPQERHRMLRGVYEPNRELPTGFWYKPGSEALCNNGFGEHWFRVNRWGMRDREYGLKEPGEWRILFIGDSFSSNQALAAEDIYPNVLERRVAKQFPERTISILNAGMDGWDIGVYAAYLKRFINEIEPDVVVISVLAGSDYVRPGSNNSPPPEIAIQGGVPVRKNRSALAKAKWLAWYGNQLLEEHSHAYVAVRKWLYYPMKWFHLGRYPSFQRLTVDPEMAKRAEVPICHVLANIQALCQQNGARLALSLVPRMNEITPRDIWLEKQFAAPDTTALDTARPARFMARTAESLKVPFHDPSQKLASHPEATYLPIFAHWNAAGNRIVAKSLHGFLLSNGLLGPQPGINAD